MKNDIDELLSRAFGRRTAPAGEPQLTLGPQPETPAGKRPAPKAAQGGQKRPATQQAAPAQKPSSAHGSGPKPQHGAAGDAFHKGAHTVDSLQKSVLEMNSLLEETAAAQRAELEVMSQSALEDIARIRREVNTPAVQNLARGAGESEPLPGVAGAGAEAFGGLEEELGINIKVLDYSEHALTSGSGAQAASYIHMMDQDRKRVTYGIGISSNITRASLRGIFSAVNRLYGDN